ncbi:hypothetical protein H4Q32_010289 [Labeo rohita]|uniref:Synaptic vesicle membrane VAT-1-like protein n=1 Tax=Labeo rohita TaxID=84645 RepID=A0ABQ8MUB4_LABRO|nr:hypothetical protein H4Q32_010289 [Labeo rohita]
MSCVQACSCFKICFISSLGGVGIAATQLCKTVNDVTVFGTASASKHEVISQGGVTHAIDYRTRLDIVLDPLGGSDTHKGYNLLKPMGKLISYEPRMCPNVADWVRSKSQANSELALCENKKNLFAVAKTWYQQFSVHTLSLIQGNRSVCGFHLGYLDSETELIAQAMAAVMDLYRQGKIKPRIDSTYHLEQVNERVSDSSRLNSWPVKLLSLPLLIRTLTSLFLTISLSPAQVGDAMRRMQERNNIGKIILNTEPMKEEEKKEEAKKEEEKKKDDKKKDDKKKEDKKKDDTKKEEKKEEKKKEEAKKDDKKAEEKKEEPKKEEN